MRTVTITHEMQLGGGATVSVSTEVLVENDQEAELRGWEAAVFLRRFIEGAGRDTGED